MSVSVSPLPVVAPARAPVVPWHWLAATLLVTLVLRTWISATFPLTGDEAFFYWWGVYPAWGYYDHPPMVGWWIALTRAVLGEAAWAVRLPAVLLPLALCAMLAWGLSALDRQRALWAVLLYALVPLNWLYAFITTDTPLIFFSVLSACALLRAEARARLDRTAWGLYALSGMAIGCAFLSKYFSVVMGLAYLVYFAAYRRERWPALLLLTVCALPGPLINLAFNMGHGWPNIMFNAINRNEGTVFSWTQPAIYAAMLAYLVTPAALWWLWKARRQLWQNRSVTPAHRLLACLVVVPFLFFAVLTARKVIGLHWVLSFYPFGFALLALAVPADRLRALALGVAAFGLVHAMAVAALYATTLDMWRSTSLYPSIVRSYKAPEILARVEAPGFELMADAYTPAAIYGYERQRYMPVFGPGRFHARQDDLLVDFSVYDGRNLRILRAGAADPAQLPRFEPYFDQTRLWEFEESGVRFHVVEGTRFRYAAYREGPLTEAYRRYYQIPEWLPLTGCPFCERLCGQTRCAIR